ncbi:protein snwA [Hyalella azteca]|uniref:Protein snwA n=1 Tax=Hyalella azteca TaxID=294128 RepID=A0A8B7NN60_HYAAZ|nr:protein snwA [Hyalella azteca]XP_018015113.1 protein snwA [Hyalella azteca]
MISTVDIFLKWSSKSRQKKKAPSGTVHSRPSEASDDESDRQIPVAAARPSKRQSTRRESSDDSASLRVAQSSNKQLHSSFDSESDEFAKANARKQAKNRSTRSNIEIKQRKKKSKNVRSSTRSNKSKSASKSKQIKAAEDVQSDDENLGRKEVKLSKRFKSVDMLNAAHDADINYRTDSVSSVREREEERKQKARSIFLELKVKQELERKEKLAADRRRKEEERYRLEYGGSMTPNSDSRANTLDYARQRTATNASSDDLDRFGVPEKQAFKSNDWSGASQDGEQLAPSMKQLVLSDNGQGARSKHYTTTQAVIEHSVRQSQRTNAGPSAPPKPKKKGYEPPESHIVSSHPPPNDGNFRRVPYSQIKNPTVDANSVVRSSCRPVHQPHPVMEVDRAATLSHSRRHDHHATQNPVPYDQWSEDGYSTGGRHPSQANASRHHPNMEYYQEGQNYYPQEYEKNAYSYQENVNVPLPEPEHGSYDPRLHRADLV